MEEGRRRGDRDRKKTEKYLMLTGSLQEDRELRQRLHMRRLEDIVEIQGRRGERQADERKERETFSKHWRLRSSFRQE